MSKPLVLLAEDEENIVFSLRFILERAGFDVLSVSDGQQVEQTVHSTLPDVLILDIMLPHRSGFDILAAIRGRRSTAEIPVLVLTAKGFDRDMRRAIDLGANAFMTKPFSNADVLSKVNELLKRGSDRGSLNIAKA